jgi:adenosylhomocysteine nucleosidase
VRIISDTVDDRLPPEIEMLLAEKSLAGKLGTAAAAILNRFSAVGDMWQLYEDALKCSQRLARFLRGMIGQME